MVVLTDWTEEQELCYSQIASTAMWEKVTWADQNPALRGKALSVLARVLGGSYSASILELDGEHAYSALGYWPSSADQRLWLRKSLWAVAGFRGFVLGQPHWRHFLPISGWCVSGHSWWVWVGLYWAIWKGLWLPGPLFFPDFWALEHNQMSSHVP